jgi:hypothetical protein
MKDWHLKVPKGLHIYWGGGHLVYLRYLTVVSFMKHNPDWKVFLWYPKVPFTGRSWGIEKGCERVNERLCKDYFPELLKLNIEKTAVDFLSLGFARNAAEVHKADYMRINLMYHVGGVWSDMDILYFKPITEMKANTPENADKETFVCITDYGHSTGFNMAIKQSKFFEKLRDSVNVEYKSNEYQSLGPDMFNKYFKTIESIPNAVNLDMDVVYAHNCHKVKELLGSGPKRFTEGSIGCHWYGGNSIWGGFLNRTGGGVSNLPKCIISDLIREV